MRHTCVRLVFVAVLAGLLASSNSTALVAADHPHPLATFKGLTAGEWLASWWQAVFATPVEAGRHPLSHGGAVGASNRTAFLVSPVLEAGSGTVTVPVRVPPGTHLVVPIITVSCSEAEAPPFHGEGEAELRACANGLLDFVSDASASIDGIAVADAQGSRVETPLFRYGPLPADNALHLLPGTQSDAVAAGYVLVLPPLSAGVHRIRVRANVIAFGLAADAEFIVHVG